MHLQTAISKLRAHFSRFRAGRPPSLEVTAIPSYQDYLHHRQSSASQAGSREQIEMGLLAKGDSFHVEGYCYPCDKPSSFLVDYRYGSEVDGLRIPNWRETLACDCGLNNRLRASVQLFDQYCHPRKTDRIYITEQTTSIYRWLGNRYPQLTGSEYLGDQIPFGTLSKDGVRNESLARLSFPDDHFDHIISFDVLEHIPAVEKALGECHRCLKPGGNLLLSVPFVVSAEETLVRARLGASGEVEHLLPPEYHGDPLSTEGCLCFYHFGWDLLDRLRSSGFKQAHVLLYWSRELGYLGGEQLQLIAKK